MDSGWLSMGEVTRKFENEFSEFLGVKHSIAVANATAALHLANLALDLNEESEVVCPALTFVASANSIIYTGAKPVFADIIDTNDFNISPDDIESKITEKTRAIQVVHYAGYPCNMNRIMELARKYKLYVIEDSAHAHGAEYQGEKCGAIGDIGCFSFLTNKNMTTVEGGMVTTNNDELAAKIRILRSQGMTSLSLDRFKGHAFSYDVVEIGYNYRIDEIRSAIGIVQLDKLKLFNEKRKQLVQIYNEKLVGIKEVSIPFEKNQDTSAHHIFPLLLDEAINRQQFMEHMKGNGIQTSIHYPPAHLFTIYRKKFKYKEGLLPVTENVAMREITLPLYPAMSKNDVHYICDVIVKYFQKGNN
jgi:dTDP-4-amino-4,6-dideoxygalactose transaminase